MLEYAGTAIAMKNSSKAVLEMADYITTDVTEDGIWNALKWLGVLDKE
jgi:hydroxymethylpyrimidine pyrophosphatase-like HAD family hydrolase